MLEPKTYLFDDRWGPHMEPTVLKLLKQEPVTRGEWQDLFWEVHTVCLWDTDKGSTKLRDALEKDIKEFIKQTEHKVKQHEEDSALLKAYISEWSKFFEQCDYLPKPFTQLETAISGRTHATNKKKEAVDSIVRKLMLDSWNASIFSAFNRKLQTSAMELVRNERQGKAFDSQLVIGVRESFVNLGSETDDPLKIYREIFEDGYIKATESHYKAEAPTKIKEDGVLTYMEYAERQLNEEEKRAKKYLETRQNCKSVEILVERCVNVLVTQHKDQILEKCPQMIKENQTDRLKRMFLLMDRIKVSEGSKNGPVTIMEENLKKHIIEDGIQYMKEHADSIAKFKDPTSFVDALLNLFAKYSELVQLAFNDDHRFSTVRDQAYKEVVNDVSIFHVVAESSKKSGQKPKGDKKKESRCATILAQYCDRLLNSKQMLRRRMTPEDVDKKLKEVLKILNYVQNKDWFMNTYQTQLTKRLILELTADNEQEENMVEQLRTFSSDQVKKLVRMFQDIKVCEDLNAEFKDFVKGTNEETHAKQILDTINIKILHSGAWSRPSDFTSVTFPNELEEFIPLVEDFYKKKHSGRKLKWNHILSNGTIEFQNEVGKWDLEVSTVQMAVLFSWNLRPNDKMNFDALLLATELPAAVLKKTLIELSLKKFEILSHAPKFNPSEEMNPDTEFWINQQFAMKGKGNSKVIAKKGKLTLIDISSVSYNEVDQKEDTEAIINLRILRIQEAIVKIMKMRQRLSNAQLQTELVEILKNLFFPSKKVIKEQIEWLIENNFLKREEDNPNMFLYMA